MSSRWCDTPILAYIISTRLFFNRKTFFCKFSSSKFKISCIINPYNLFIHLLDQFSKKKFGPNNGRKNVYEWSKKRLQNEFANNRFLKVYDKVLGNPGFRLKWSVACRVLISMTSVVEYQYWVYKMLMVFG